MLSRSSGRDGPRLSHLPALALLAALITPASASPWTHCPHHPGGRLENKGSNVCHVPGKIGIVDDDSANEFSWSFPPRCMTQTPRDTNSTRIDCLFTSTEFRNQHGTSLVTSVTTASHLIGMDAFVDKPSPLQATKRESLGPAYEVRQVPGKGYGVIATRRIKAGEIVMVDFPAVLIEIAFLADTKPHHRRRILKQAINQLPEETRNKVYKLHRGSSKYEVDAILGPNTNTVVIAESEVHVGLFPEVARINHSCRPNAFTRFSERRLTMEIVAYHEIKPGEEILISYVPLETPVEQRRRYLRDNWGFECTCSLCRGPPDELENSESWRRKTKSLKETIADAKSSGYYKDAIVMAEELLMFSEWDRVPPFMPDYHDTLAHLHYLNGNMANATRYGRMALDGWAKFGSVDDDDLEKAREFLEHLFHTHEKAT